MCLGQVLLPNELQKEFWFLGLLILDIRSEGLWTTVTVIANTYRIYYVSGHVLSTLYIPTYLIFTTVRYN